MTAVDSLVGFAAGFAASMLTHAMSAAGEIISHDMGFAMSQVMDPITGRSHAVMSQLFQTIASLKIFAHDLHHGFIKVLAKTYEWVPVGHGFDMAPVYEKLNSLISFSLHAAMQYAFPVMGALVLLTAVLVMLARAVQNINLMEFSFGLRIGLGIFVAIFFIAEGMPFFKNFADSVLKVSYSLFQGTT
jgi:flagellar biosynthetic protein FliR